MLGFGLIFLVTRKIIVPVRQLNTAVNRMQEGDLSYRVPVGGSGEISELASSFNSMTAKLEAAEIQRQKLLADVAHELRTPLTNARGYVEAMRDGVMPTDSQVVASVYRQMVHLTNLVDDLRILTLAESGHLEFRMELDSVTDILNASVREFEPVAMAKGISLKLNCPSYLPLVTLDRTRINQVLNNLIQNAIFHTPENGSVILSAKISGEQISVMVADSGPGIEQDNLPHLFDRFYRSDQSRNRSSGGSGLGLAIARHLVEAHGGTIEAKSQKNEGSVFTFTLPINPVKSDQSPTEVSLIKVSN
jgi:signal transduction histidine kinase